MAIIIDKQNYKLTVEKKSTIPSEVKHLIFHRESFDTEGKSISYNHFELFISESDIEKIKEAL
jgi:hypothetical protein|tara:strand:- start:2411 stop:2599 length:189 start_codon:yes stop_codon:yes gene_type:complete